MCPYNCFLWCKNSQEFLGAICYSKKVLSEDHKKYFNYVSLIPLQPTFLILRHTLSPWNRYNIKVAFESCRSLRFNLVNIRGLPSRFVEIYVRVLPIYLGDSIDSRALNFVRWFRLELTTYISIMESVKWALTYLHGFHVLVLLSLIIIEATFLLLPRKKKLLQKYSLIFQTCSSI